MSYPFSREILKDVKRAHTRTKINYVSVDTDIVKVTADREP